MKRRLSAMISLILVLLLAMSTAVSAHSGRTDSYGGHRDNKNKSGLGSYHYHCGGYPAHLHPGGICPYTSTPEPSGNNSGGGSSVPAAPSNDVVVIQNLPEMLTVGKTHRLTCSVTYAEGSSGGVSWSSSDPSVVEVSDSGVLTAKGEGSATITAVTENGEAEITVEVQLLPVKQVTLEADAAEIQVGKTLYLSAGVLPEEASYPELSYTSSNEAVAKVSADGKVTAISPGSVVITATAPNGVAAALELEVFGIPMQSITLDGKKMEFPQGDHLQPGETVEAVVTFQPANATDTDYELFSSNEEVIKIADGQIQAVGVGSAVITVRSKQDGQLTDSMEVTVKEDKKESTGVVGFLLLVTAAGCGFLFYRSLKKKN